MCRNPSQGTWPGASCLWVVSQSSARGVGTELWTLPSAFCAATWTLPASPAHYLPPPHGHTLTPFPCLELRVSVYTSWAVLGTSGNLPGPVFLLCKMETGKICLVALPRPLGQPAPVSSWGGRVEASWARLRFCGTPAWATISKHLLRTNYKPSCEPVPPVSAAPHLRSLRQGCF